MDHLDYQSVLSCAATSKTILHDAMPLIKSLHIDNASEMNILLAKRFRDVQNINLLSLLKGRAEEGNMKKFQVDYDAIMKVVPFLSQFHNLGRVFLGGRKVNGEIVSFHRDHYYWNEGDNVNEATGRVHTLIDMISGAFRSSGGLLSNVKVMGLRCPYSNPNSQISTDCKVCKRACRSFPLNQVVNFDNKGSSDNRGKFSCKRMPFMDVCLTRIKIENIIEERPGGKALLQSNKHLYHLLGQGLRYEIKSDDGTPLYIVGYNGTRIKELKRVIERAELDVKNLSREDVTRAIWRSFATDEQSALPPKEQCYFCISSITLLINDLGLPISRLDFGLKAANVKNLPQIVKGIMSDDATSVLASSFYCHCIQLLFMVLKNSAGEEYSITTQKVINLEVIPKLVQSLDDGNRSCNGALNVLNNIAWKGSIGNAQVLVDAGIIPKLCLLMNSSNAKVAETSTCILGKLASKNNAVIRDAVLQDGALTSLLNQAKKYYDNPEVMKSNQGTLQKLLAGNPAILAGNRIPLPNLEKIPINMDTLSHLLSVGQAGNEKILHYACLALSYICLRHSSIHHNAMIEAGLFPRLLDLPSCLSSKIQHYRIWTIRCLIRQDKSLIERVISDDKFPLFISCTQSPVKVTRIVVCEVICCLLNGTKEQVAVFVGQGCVRALCSVLTFSHSSAQATDALLGLTKVRLIVVCVNFM